MISKVKDASIPLIQQYQKNDLARNEADKSLAVVAAAGEKVSLSSKAKDIQQIRQILDDIPDVREDRVRELKARIESGTYTVHPEKIAEKMAAESLIDLFV